MYVRQCAKVPTRRSVSLTNLCLFCLVRQCVHILTRPHWFGAPPGHILEWATFEWSAGALPQGSNLYQASGGPRDPASLPIRSPPFHLPDRSGWCHTFGSPLEAHGRRGLFLTLHHGGGGGERGTFSRRCHPEETHVTWSKAMSSSPGLPPGQAVIGSEATGSSLNNMYPRRRHTGSQMQQVYQEILAPAVYKYRTPFL